MYLPLFAVVVTFQVVCFFLFACFIILESSYRYQFLHNYPKAIDSGGRLWLYFLHFILSSMLISQLTLVGLLALKQSPFAGPAVGPLITVTLIFIIYVNDKHTMMSKHLTTHDCLLHDKNNQINGITSKLFAHNKYLQPALCADSKEPEYDEGHIGVQDQEAESTDGEKVNDDIDNGTTGVLDLEASGTI
jgi:hypothetical protein